jgi:hypothetical protein
MLNFRLANISCWWHAPLPVHILLFNRLLWKRVHWQMNSDDFPCANVIFHSYLQFPEGIYPYLNSVMPCHDHAVDKSGLFTTNHCPQTPANRPRNSLWPALSHWARGSKAKAWCERPEAIHITVRLSESIIVSLCNYILYYILISYNILHEGIERITNAKHTECRDLLWYGRWRVVRMSHPLHPCGSLTVAAWGCYELCKWLLTST